MQVLQINNTGVVPYTIKEFFRRNPEYNIKMDLVIPMHSERDRQFQRGLVGVIEIGGDPKILQEWIRRNVNKYDIIHLHALFQHLPLIDRYKRKDAKIVYTGHGREVRQGWHPIIKKFSDKMTCATKDLQVNGVEFVPNVPDPEHFKRTRKGIKNKALIKSFGDLIVDDKRGYLQAHALSKELGYKLDVQERNKKMYSYMVYPRFLEVYSVFFDYKYLRNDLGYEFLELPLSFTALQFLQLGGTVYHHSGIHTELPSPHSCYECVMKRWKDIYEQLLG